MIDLYQGGEAPRDSVNRSFDEIVAGFYSGACPFLDQDLDSLIAVAERMPAEDFAVMPMPVSPSGEAFPTIGIAGWSMFETSERKDAAWRLIAALCAPEATPPGPSAWASSRSTRAPSRIPTPRPSSSRAGSRP